MDYRLSELENYRWLSALGDRVIGGVPLRLWKLGGHPFFEINAPELSWRHLSNEHASSNVLRWKLRVKRFWFSVRLVALIVIKIFSGHLFSNKSSNAPTLLQYENSDRIRLYICFDSRVWNEIFFPALRNVTPDNSVVYANFPRPSNCPKDIQWLDRSSLRSSESSQLCLLFQFVSFSFKFLRSVDGRSRFILFPLLENLQRNLTDYCIAEKIFRTLNIGQLVAADISDSKTRIYLAQAQALGIDRLVYQFGLIDHLSVEYRFDLGCSFIAWNEYFAEVLEFHGINRKRISFANHPRFSLSYVGSIKDRIDTIAVVSTYSDPAHLHFLPANLLEQMKSDVIEEIQNWSAIKIYKPHPSEKLSSFYKQKYLDNFVLIESQEAFWDLLKPGDLIIHFGSTMAFDALARGLKVITVAYEDWPFLSPAFTAAGFEIVRNRIELQDAIFRSFNSDENYFETIQRVARFVQ